MSADSAQTSRAALRDVVARMDLRVVVPALVLSGIGILSISSTRPDLVMSQVQGLALGLVLASLLTLVPYRTMLAAAWPFFALTTLLLAVVLVPGIGHGAKGAHRWLRFGDVQFQPSEIAKAAQVLLLAQYIRFRQDHKSLKGLVVPFVLTLIPALLILKEPDLGSSLLLVPMLFAMLWAAGARSRHLVTVVLLAVASVPLVYVNLQPYQRSRVDTYLRGLDGVLARVGIPSEVKVAVDSAQQRDADYHVTQAVAAVANGGVLGQGYRKGPMNLANRVPEDWTDFIFVVHAEEWGLVGVLVLLLAFGALLAALTILGQECRDPAARLICVGAMTLLGVQACLNMMMTIGLAPVTGVPLPFLSYGRSAMVGSWILIGLALHARSREPHVFTTDDFGR